MDYIAFETTQFLCFQLNFIFPIMIFLAES